MRIDQITKLLFAATVVAIFSYLLVFSSMGHAGNGGEYWGFDGYTEPWLVARNSFKKGDYRLLEVAVPDPFGKVALKAPAYQPCDNHPLGKENALWRSSGEPIHGADSFRLAHGFAGEYNRTMMWQLSDLMNNRCEVWTD